MSRIASVALGGYYKTPTHLLDPIGALVEIQPGHHSFFDPCAGDGEALFHLDALWTDAKASRYDRELSAIELEADRHLELLKRFTPIYGEYNVGARCLHADAFTVRHQSSYSYQGCSVLYLNPPYDMHPVRGRLEEAFLERFTPMVMPNGVLLYLVPVHALAASAKTLATCYRNHHVFRFPQADYEAYKQVVLVANRADGDEFQQALYDNLINLGQNPNQIPELNGQRHVVTALANRQAALQLSVQPVDYKALLGSFKAWHTSAGKHVVPAEAVIPATGLGNLLTRHYPLAMPPKAGHIATGVAAGIFNGKVLDPDEIESPLPRLLIKGCFRRDWRQIEEKKNKSGVVVGQVQVQQPVLEVSVFDMKNLSYHTLRSEEEQATWDGKIASMSTGDLLQNYGAGMLDALIQQCPVGYDPKCADQQIELAHIKRPLYPAQAHVVKAALYALGGPTCALKRRRGKFALILGEIGSGKTQCSLALIKHIGSKRPLVLCPPHLLQGWQDQVREVVPEYTCHVLSDVEDVQRFAALKGGLHMGILSRETAKLGHERVATQLSVCPACFGPLPTGKNNEALDCARQRLRCECQRQYPANALGRWTQRLAYAAATLLTTDKRDLLSYAYRRRLATRPVTEEQKDLGWDTAVALLPALAKHVLGDLLQQGSAPLSEDAVRVLTRLGLMLQDEQLLEYVQLVYWLGAALGDSQARQLARTLSMSLPPHLFDLWADRVACCPDRLFEQYYSSYSASNSAGNMRAVYACMRANNPVHSIGYDKSYAYAHWIQKEGVWCHDNLEPVTEETLNQLISALRLLAPWNLGRVCGSPLYQSVAQPTKRVALANYIATHAKHAFDTLICDEIQEFNNADSSQAIAAHLLMGLGYPTLWLTGSVSNGYASSLFANLWAMDREFREEFPRNGLNDFVVRYGYRKRMVEDRDKEEGKIVAYGTVSDRVERTARIMGHAPGVLPLFIYRYLLKHACVLHKSDTAEIPPLREHRVVVDPLPEQAAAYRHLEEAVKAQLRQDQFVSGRAGKLFGAISELPSYLDLCGLGPYEVRYPQALDNELVATGEVITGRLPKEAWLLAFVKEHAARGDRVMVFTEHEAIQTHLEAFLKKESGLKVVSLVARKVPTAKRQAWIDDKVVRAKADVLIVNPKAVQTGLNNLVYFNKAVFFEDPACDPITYRQAIGRIDRIGQVKATDVYCLVYKDTHQELVHRLLMLKVAVSRATDGLDAEGALVAAGAVDGHALDAAQSVGRLLAQKMMAA